MQDSEQNNDEPHRLGVSLMRVSAVNVRAATCDTYRGEYRVYVGNEEPTRGQECKTDEDPTDDGNRNHAQELGGCQRDVARKRGQG